MPERCGVGTSPTYHPPAAPTSLRDQLGVDLAAAECLSAMERLTIQVSCPWVRHASQINNGLSIAANVGVLLGITLGARALAFALLFALHRLKRL